VKRWSFKFRTHNLEQRDILPDNSNYHCPLCQSVDTSLFARDKKRDYQRCETCKLVSVPGEFHLNASQEKAEYDKHQNDPQDKGYQGFLARTTQPLFSRMNAQSDGLDFGCGPGPAISDMAKEYELKVSNYDLYYFNNPELLKLKYDFVTMTEVIEHIARPAPLLEQLDSLLRPCAILAIMTKRVLDEEAFKRWHYKNDPTHISFYSIETFEWIAEKLNWQLEVIEQDVVFFHKSQ